MASRLQDVILRGTAAARPAATTVAPGTLYYATDTSTTARCADDGLTWETFSDAGGTPAAHHASHETGGADAIVALSGSVITTGTVPAARLGAHAATHGSGGTDPVTVTTLAGYPGGSTTFLRGDGTFATPAGAAARRQVTVLIDGGGAAIPAGVKAFLSLPLAGTWKKWRLLSIDGAATAGSIVLDVWKDTYAAYPPTVADTITASAKPTLSAANKNEDSTLTGWTTGFAAGDVLGVNVDSASTVTKVQLVLEFD